MMSAQRYLVCRVYDFPSINCQKGNKPNHPSYGGVLIDFNKLVKHRDKRIME